MVLDNLLLRPLAEREALGWTHRRLNAGERLFHQGEMATTLHVVAAGALDLFVDGVPIAEIGRGETLGEASVFIPGETRLGAAVARAETEVWSLHRLTLRALRDDRHPLYDLILESALRETWRRLREVDAELVRLGGAELASLERPSAFRRLLDRLLQPGQGPDPTALLASLPGLSWASPIVRAEIAERLTPVYMPAGRALFVQGDAGDDLLYLVASGTLSIQREGPEGVRILTELRTGSLFGAAAFVTETPRTASAVAVESSWVFALSRGALTTLGDLARRTVLEAVLFTMRKQLRAANSSLVLLRRPARDFRQLLRAAGSVQGWRAGDPGTDVRLEDIARPQPIPMLDDDAEALLALLRESVIGRDVALRTPFGLKRIVYADYTASGRCLTFIEDFLRDHVMPLYANTHTEASASGLQTTRFREEARAVVARSVNAGPDHSVIFVGSGATAAIHRLIDLLGLRAPSQKGRPVVFVGPYEHHSNLLPWRHCEVDLVTIPLDATGHLDREALRTELDRYSDRRLRIGSFSAGSNVTGVSTDVDGIAELLHEHGALSVWDYAAAGPYVRIDMNPANRPGARKDAVFISPHKFVGGPGTPGVLVVANAITSLTTPTHPGGGTVDFVTATASMYSDSLVHREEAGTPAILESIRCGLVFGLKDQVGADTIHAREQELVRAAIDAWSRNPAIEVLGPLDAERLSIVSFLVRHGRGYLHYNFVVALLNDLFGIQARGGCSCAGPYGSALLGLDAVAGDAFLRLVGQGCALLKPGWARVNFNYFVSAAEHAFIVQAVNLVAAYGYALLPEYRFDLATGLWTHRDGQLARPTRLSDLRLQGGRVEMPPLPPTMAEPDHEGTLAEARTILERAAAARPAVEQATLPSEVEAWRWFPVPHEVAGWLTQRSAERAAAAFAPPVTR